MINKVILIGRLGQNPELKYTPNGNAVVNFSLATSEKWAGKDGQKQERTEWHSVVVWNKLAEVCAEYLAKGRVAYVEGKLQTRKWDDKEGRTHYKTEVLADQVRFLGGNGSAKTDDDGFGMAPEPGSDG